MRVDPPKGVCQSLSFNELDESQAVRQGKTIKIVPPEKEIPEGLSKAGVGLYNREVKKHSIKRVFLSFADTVKSALGINTRRYCAVQNISSEERKQLTHEILNLWTGKSFNDFSKSDIKRAESFNSSAMMMLSKLRQEGGQLATTGVSGCLTFASEKDAGFTAIGQDLLEEAFKTTPSLKDKIHNCKGLLKTPVILVSNDNGKAQYPEETENILLSGKANKYADRETGVTFYPRGDTQKTSSTSVITIFIPTDTLADDRGRIVEGLANGLKRAFKHAEKQMPDNLKETRHSRKTASWLLKP